MCGLVRQLERRAASDEDNKEKEASIVIVRNSRWWLHNVQYISIFPHILVCFLSLGVCVSFNLTWMGGVFQLLLRSSSSVGKQGLLHPAGFLLHATTPSL